MQLSAVLVLLIFMLPLVIADPYEDNVRRHSELAKRAGADVGLLKRFSNARFTFFQPGLGACGKQSSARDFIVALNSAQFGGGSDCFKEITITANGKTCGATIMDECPSCPHGALDMSPALFNFFASESVGVVFGSWVFGNGGGSSPTATTHTSVSHKPAFATHAPAASTTKQTTHTSISTPTSATLSTPLNYASGDAYGLASPTGAVGSNAIYNLNAFNQAIIDLGAIIVAGGTAN